MKKKPDTDNSTIVRQLCVLENYGGVLTNEQRILPGVYAENDPLLFGIAEYLVDGKFAVWLDDPSQSTV